MKNALIKDFGREIKRNKGRFMSIFFIVLLGTAFFAGIRSAGTDMKYNADLFYKETNMMDIRVLGGLGLTDDDIKAFEQLDSVEAAYGGYTADMLVHTDTDEIVVRVIADSKDVNLVTLTSGRLPEKENECLVDSEAFGSLDCEIGSVIRVESGDDTDIEDTLNVTEFTVVGTGILPYYMDLTRGVSLIGDGTIRSFLIVTPETFNIDYYTESYIKLAGADAFNSYSDEYKELSDAGKKEIESLEKEYSQRRLDEVRSEALDEINDAQEEVDDGLKELDDAKEELDDAEKELDDAKDELDDGKAELDDAKKELDDARTELDDGRKELEDAQKELADAKAQLDDAKAELDDAKAELADGAAQLADAQKELAEAKEQLDEVKTQLDDGAQQLADGKKQLDETAAQLGEARSQLDETAAQLKEAKTQLDAGKEELDSNAEVLSKSYEDLTAAKSELDQSKAVLDEAKAQLDALRAQLDQAKAQLDYITDPAQYAAAAAALEAGEAAYAENAAKYEAGLGRYNAGLAQYEEGLAQYNAGKAAYDAGLAEYQQNLAAYTAGVEAYNEGEAQYAEGKALYDAGLEEYNKNLETYNASVEEYNKGLADYEEGLEQYNKAKAEYEDGVKQYEEGLAEYNEGLAEYKDGLAEYEKGKKEYEDGLKEYEDGLTEYEDGKKEYEDGLAEYEDGLAEYEDGLEEYNDAYEKNMPDIIQAQKDIADARKKLDELEAPELYIYDRDDISSAYSFGQDAGRMDSLGNVFPVIFFLVAALVSLTAMTRMVEEQRQQIGTLKALGFSNGTIIMKYFSYAMTATLTGGILGVIIGEIVLPFVVMDAYHMLYTGLPYLYTPPNLTQGILGVAAACASTGIATYAACRRKLAENPASLMRPESPKAGQKVLLEYIPFIWKKLNFSLKSTIRNLFRYKKRLIMTIVGIGSCMGLLMVGFGLEDSITTIAKLQYKEIFKQDASIVIDANAKASEKDELLAAVEAYDGIDESQELYQLSVTLKKDGAPNRSAFIYVPGNRETMFDFIRFRDRVTLENYEFPEDGVALSEKTAEMLGISVGDTVIIDKGEGKGTAEARVDRIVENYVQHYCFMLPETYEKLFGEEPDYNSILLKISDTSDEAQSRMATDLLKLDACVNISFTTDLQVTIDDMLKALHYVIWVIILSAGLLAFVVIYNLNNINITERVRELATLKVLGFYDGEVAMYVYRENIFLTVIGVLIGFVFGKILHGFTIKTVEVDLMMFGRSVLPISYLYSALLTLLFAFIVNVLMFFSLKKINMIESLKSVD